MDLIKLIKKKKYEGLSDEFIKKEIELFLRKNPKIKKEDLIIKGVRKRLHNVYGVFQLDKKKRRRYLQEKDFINLLKSNISTRERLKYYKKLYKNIFSITGRPKSILDLGCGLNPVSFEFMDLGEIKYYAVDIDKDDLEFLDTYFKIKRIDGKTDLLDVTEDNLSKLPKADVCFLFKALDTFERKKGHKFAEKLIKSLKCKFVVASFPTRTVGGKKMNYPRRGWIERMLERLNFEFETLIFENEIFYVIKSG